MTWEILVGLFTLTSVFITVMNVVVRVNRTMTSLESAVKQLREYMEKQSTKNEKIFVQLSEHEVRLAKLEGSVNGIKKYDTRESDNNR